MKRGRSRAIPGRGAGAGRVDLTVDLGPVALPNPVVAASGTFGHGDEVAKLCDPRGLGAVTVKSVAVFAWSGNPPLRVVEAPGGGMLNSVGLPGPGIDAWIERDLPALEALGARVVASIWGRSVEEYVAAASPLKPVAHRLTAVEVNLSCPNVEARGHVFAHSEAATRAATLAVVDALGGAVPAFAKLSPNVTDIVAIAGAAIDAGATGLTLVNSMMGLLIDAARARAASGRGWRGIDRRADPAHRAPRGVGRRPRVPRGADHRDRRGEQRRGRDRDDARGRDRGRGRHRDLRRPASDAADRERDRDLVRGERRSRASET